MNITRRSPLTGDVHTFDLPICQPQIDAYESGRLLQHAFANLEPWEREFYKTGYTPDDWRRISNEALFAPGDRVQAGDDVGFVVSVQNNRSEVSPVSYDIQVDNGPLREGVLQSGVRAARA